MAPLSKVLSAGQLQEFMATVNIFDQAVTWSISPSVGTIDQGGLYTAPSAPDHVHYHCRGGGLSGVPANRSGIAG